MKDKKGFTLVEILAVIVVMGIIAVIAVPIYNNTSAKVKQKEYENLIATIEVAAERYADKTSKIRFSVQELIDNGEYETDNEQGDVLSPIDNKRLNCHIINVDYENDNYSATFTDEDDCDVANSLKDTFGVTIAAEDESGSKWTNQETKWTKYNVTLTASINNASLPAELKGKEYTTTYDWFAGNVKVSDINSATYKVEAQTILNTIYQVRVTIHTEEKEYTAGASIKIQIDKQKPIISSANVDKADIWTNTNKTVTLAATDFNGSGVYGTYIGKENTCPASKSKYHVGSDYTTILGMGKYILCAMDNIGNISEANENNSNNFITISKIDTKIDTMNLTINKTGYAVEKTLTGTAQDTESGIVAYQFTRSNTYPNTWKDITQTTEKITQTYKVTGNGTYYFWVKDGAGNVSYRSYTESKIGTLKTITLSTLESRISSNVELKESLQGIKAIDSITVDNGQVRSYSVGSNSVTISFKNGTLKTGTTMCDYSMTPKESVKTSSKNCSYKCDSGGSRQGKTCVASQGTKYSLGPYYYDISCWCGGPGGKTSGCTFPTGNHECAAGYSKTYNCSPTAPSKNGQSCSWYDSKKVGTTECNGTCTWKGNYSATKYNCTTTKKCSSGTTEIDGKCYSCDKGTLNPTDKMCEYSESCNYTYYKYTATINYVI